MSENFQLYDDDDDDHPAGEIVSSVWSSSEVALDLPMRSDQCLEKAGMKQSERGLTLICKFALTDLQAFGLQLLLFDGFTAGIGVTIFG